jgi:hypothetical protein
MAPRLHPASSNANPKKREIHESFKTCEALNLRKSINMSVVTSGFTVANKTCETYDPTDPKNSQQDIYVQLVLSLALGLSAFLGFCVSAIVQHLCALLTTVVSSAKMERTIRCAQEAERRSCITPRAS